MTAQLSQQVPSTLACLSSGRSDDGPQLLCPRMRPSCHDGQGRQAVALT